MAVRACRGYASWTVSSRETSPAGGACQRTHSGETSIDALRNWNIVGARRKGPSSQHAYGGESKSALEGRPRVNVHHRRSFVSNTPGHTARKIIKRKRCRSGPPIFNTEGLGKHRGYWLKITMCFIDVSVLLLGWSEGTRTREMNCLSEQKESTRQSGQTRLA